MQSGGYEPFAFAPSPNYERTTVVSEHLFDLLGSRNPDVLRQAPSDELAQASLEVSGTTPAPGHVHTPTNLIWRPVPDDVVVSETDFPGWPQDVPVLLGCVENEARHFITPGETYTRAGFERMAKVIAGPRADDVVAPRERSGQNWYEALDQLVTSAIYLEPALATLNRFTELHRRVYYYHFALVSPVDAAVENWPNTLPRSDTCSATSPPPTPTTTPTYPPPCSTHGSNSHVPVRPAINTGQHGRNTTTKIPSVRSSRTRM